MIPNYNDGLKCFSLDVYFFDDINIKIIRNKFGSNGISGYLYLLCDIYRQGYYCQIDDDFITVMAYALNIKENLIRQLINLLVKRDLFSKELWESDKILTSAAIQRHYQTAKKNCNEVMVDSNIWLLSKEETEDFILFQ